MPDLFEIDRIPQHLLLRIISPLTTLHDHDSDFTFDKDLKGEALKP